MDAVLPSGGGTIGIETAWLVRIVTAERAGQPLVRLGFHHSRRRGGRLGRCGLGGEGWFVSRCRGGGGSRGGRGLQDSSERAHGPRGEQRRGEQTGQYETANQDSKGQLSPCRTPLVMITNHANIISQLREGKLPASPQFMQLCLRLALCRRLAVVHGLAARLRTL